MHEPLRPTQKRLDRCEKGLPVVSGTIVGTPHRAIVQACSLLPILHTTSSLHGQQPGQSAACARFHAGQGRQLCPRRPGYGGRGSPRHCRHYHDGSRHTNHAHRRSHPGSFRVPQQSHGRNEAHTG